MNRNEIIRMAREAGMAVVDDQYSLLPFLERFAALVAAEIGIEMHRRGYESGLRDGVAAEREAGQKWFDAVTAKHKAEILAEREACAKVCDDAFDKFFAENEVEFNRQRYDQEAVKRAIQYGVEFVTADCASAIRARGKV